MIKVAYEQNKYCLTVEGHANSGVPGHDLVCASASILTDTLVLNIKQLKKQGVVKKFKTIRKEGKAVISCVPHENYTAIIMLIFQAICVGFEQLMIDYPKNILFEIIETHGVEKENENSV